MAEEKKEALLPPEYSADCSTNTPPTSMPPPPPYDASGGYYAKPPVPPGAEAGYNAYLPQPYSAYYGVPAVPTQSPFVQVTPQMSEREASTGVRRITRPQGNCCQRRWTRTHGFFLAAVLVLFGTAAIIFGAIHGVNTYNKTKDFKEGVCKNHDIIYVNETRPAGFRCEGRNCNGKNCYNKYPCYKVMGKIHYSNSNHSELVQIHAVYDDIDSYLGMCSYKPESECKRETESYFTSRGAFDGKEYTCYYSNKNSLKVVLQRNHHGITAGFALPAMLICLGVAVFVAVKFFGHKFNCPSQSQLKQHQLQPVPRT